MLSSLVGAEEESHPLHLAAWSAAGPPVLLLHGVTRGWKDWLSLIPALSARWSVRSFDLRGHGRSARTPGAYRVADYLPDLVRFVTEHEDGPVLLVGHSLGAMVAAGVAAAAPDRVLGLVLEDPTFEMTGRRMAETSFPSLFRAFRTHAGSNRPAAEIARELAEAPIDVPGEGRAVRLGSLRDAVSLRFTARCLQDLDPEVLDVPIAGGWLDGYDVPTTLAAIRCPTLLIQADFSAGGALPDDYAAELARLIPDVLLHRVDGVGHNIHGTAPALMERLLIPFLATVES